MMFSLAGSVDSLHLGDLLEWLHLTRSSGRLVLTGGRTARAFDFINGRVAFASSSRASERLASWLLRSGVSPRRKLLMALALAQTRGELFTEAAEREAGVSHKALVEAGRTLATALASRVLQEPNLTFRFDPDWPVADRIHVDLKLEPSTLIMQAAYTADTRPPSDTLPPASPVSLDGDAVEELFWTIVGELEGEAVDAAAFQEAHRALAAVGTLLQRWVSQGPPLLPLGPADLGRVRSRLDRGETFALEDSPTLAWDLLALVNGIDAPGVSRATGVGDAWRLAGEDAPELVRLITDNDRWLREGRADADVAFRRNTVARAAAARSLAGALHLEEECAAACAVLPLVLLELVVTALSRAPLASTGMQRLAVRRLLPLVGHTAGTAAGMPDVLLTALTGSPEDHPGARLATLAAFAAQDGSEGLPDGLEAVPDPAALARAVKTARSAAAKAARSVKG